MGIGFFCFFRRIFDSRFAGDRYYCDLVPADQGRQNRLIFEE
jgi:hypothetical protein